MPELLTEEKYQFLERLAADVVFDDVSDEFISLGFASEPVPFNQAPENTLLLVMTDVLYSCATVPAFPKRDCLLKGTILAKISTEARDTYLCPSYGSNDPDQGLFYSLVSQFKTGLHANERGVTTVRDHIGVYSKTYTDGYVVPLADVLYKGQPLFDDLEPQFYLRENLDMKDFLSPFSDKITVIVSDEQGKELRRTWPDSLEHSEAIRRTLDVKDSSIHFRGVVKVEVVGCTDTFSSK